QRPRWARPFASGQTDWSVVLPLYPIGTTLATRERREIRDVGADERRTTHQPGALLCRQRTRSYRPSGDRPQRARRHFFGSVVLLRRRGARQGDRRAYR